MSSISIRDFVGETFAKIEHVKDGPVPVCVGQVRPGKFERPELVFEEGLVLSVNTTNARILFKAYGDDDLVGKRLNLVLGEVEFQGRPQPAVILEPVTPPLSPDEKAKVAEKAAAAAKAAKDAAGESDIPF